MTRKRKRQARAAQAALMRSLRARLSAAAAHAEAAIDALNAGEHKRALALTLEAEPRMRDALRLFDAVHILRDAASDDAPPAAIR